MSSGLQSCMIQPSALRLSHKSCHCRFERSRESFRLTERFHSLDRQSSCCYQTLGWHRKNTLSNFVGAMDKSDSDNDSDNDDEYKPGQNKATRRLSSLSWKVATEASHEARRSSRLVQQKGSQTNAKGRPKEWKDSPAPMMDEGDVMAEENNEAVQEETVLNRHRLSWDSGWSEDEDVIVERRTIVKKGEDLPEVQTTTHTPTNLSPLSLNDGTFQVPQSAVRNKQNKKKVVIPPSDIRLSEDPIVQEFLMLVEAHMGGPAAVRDQNAWHILNCITLVQENGKLWTGPEAHEFIRLLMEGRPEDAARIAAAAAAASKNVNGLRSSKVLPEPPAVSEAPQQSSAAGSRLSRRTNRVLGDKDDTNSYENLRAQQCEKQHYNSLISERATEYKNGNEEQKAVVVESILKEFNFKTGGTPLTVKESSQKIEKDLVAEGVSYRHCATPPVVTWKGRRHKKSIEFHLYRRTIQDSTFRYKYGNESVRKSLVKEIADQFIFEDKMGTVLRQKEKIEKVETALVQELTRGPNDRIPKKKRQHSADVLVDRRAKRKLQKPDNTIPVEASSAANSEAAATPEPESAPDKVVDPLFLSSPYIEEISYHAYSGVESAADRMPPPEEFNPVFPADPSVCWRYDPATRYETPTCVVFSCLIPLEQGSFGRLFENRDSFSRTRPDVAGTHGTR